MNCPHCQKELPENAATGHCPYCGAPLISPKPPIHSRRPLKFHWWFFPIALLAPPVLTLLTALGTRSNAHQPRDPTAPLAVAFLGAITGGIICGLMIGLQCKSPAARILVSLAMIVVMFCVCLVLCCAGCAIGGQ